MESPEYVSSPEAGPKRPRSPHNNPPPAPPQDDKEKQTHVRFLVSNTAAGSIIGKGGAKITEFQSQSGARIQLSRSHEYFPRTSDRIIMISGAFNEILKAMELILEKLLSEAEVSNEVDSRSKVRLIVPNSACGCIIGKGGSTIKHASNVVVSDIEVVLAAKNLAILDVLHATFVRKYTIYYKPSTGIGVNGPKNVACISNYCQPNTPKICYRSFIEESQADIKISPQDQNYVGLNDRLVTLIGTLDEQMRAIDLILSKLIEDSHYPESLSSPFPYAGVNFPGFPGVPAGYVVPSVPYNSMNYGANGIGGKYPSNKGGSSQGAPNRSPAGPRDGPDNLVVIGIADEHIGAVVGRGGRNIMEITQASGARIKISDRGDFMSGTSDRKVTISGSPEAVRSAEAMIMQKVSANSER